MRAPWWLIACTWMTREKNQRLSLASGMERAARGDRETLETVTMEECEERAVSEPAREQGSRGEGDECPPGVCRDKERRCELKSGHWIRKFDIFREVVKAEAQL